MASLKGNTLMKNNTITIVGGGLGGLTLASILHKYGVETTIYEMDASPTARNQGGNLDMHEDSGLFALRQAGLYEAFREKVTAASDDMLLLDKAGRVLMQTDGNDTRPEIERGDLRSILLQSMPASFIRWGSKVTSVVKLAEGRHQVTLSSGEAFIADLLIGADGAWSKIRPLLSDARPIYSGISFIETHVLDADVRYPELATLVGRGTMFAFEDEKGLITQRDKDGGITLYIAFKAPEQFADSGIDLHDPETAREHLLSFYPDWNDQLRALIARSETGLIPRPISYLPIGHCWERVPGVTLLGDAAHLMSPFSGEGANLAMLDAATLATALLENPSDVEAALTSYEAAMFPRCEATATEAEKNLRLSFLPDGGQQMLNLMMYYTSQEGETR